MVRRQQDSLTDGQRRALMLHSLLARRVVMDFHLAPLAFDVAGLALTRLEALTLFESLHLIHEARCPVPKAPRG